MNETLDEEVPLSYSPAIMEHEKGDKPPGDKPDQEWQLSLKNMETGAASPSAGNNKQAPMNRKLACLESFDGVWLYRFGIIDIMQTYNAKKAIETGWKGVMHRLK